MCSSFSFFLSLSLSLSHSRTHIHTLSLPHIRFLSPLGTGHVGPPRGSAEHRDGAEGRPGEDPGGAPGRGRGVVFWDRRRVVPRRAIVGEQHEADAGELRHPAGLGGCGGGGGEGVFDARHAGEEHLGPYGPLRHEERRGGGRGYGVYGETPVRLPRVLCFPPVRVGGVIVCGLYKGPWSLFGVCTHAANKGRHPSFERVPSKIYDVILFQRQCSVTNTLLVGFLRRLFCHRRAGAPSSSNPASCAMRSRLLPSPRRTGARTAEDTAVRV